MRAWQSPVTPACKAPPATGCDYTTNDQRVGGLLRKPHRAHELPSRIREMLEAG